VGLPAVAVVAMIAGDKVLLTTAPLAADTSAVRTPGEGYMSYNSSAEIYVSNNSGGTATIHLSHQYSDDSPQQAYASEGSADDPGKICTLQSEDNGKSLTFAVDTSTFVMTELSGSCSTGVSKLN